MVDPRSFANAYRKSKSSSASSSQEPGQSPSSYLPLKVPIPRLRRSSVAPVEEGNSGSGGVNNDKHRVSHACEPCRQRKTKVCGIPFPNHPHHRQRPYVPRLLPFIPGCDGLKVLTSMSQNLRRADANSAVANGMRAPPVFPVTQTF